MLQLTSVSIMLISYMGFNFCNKIQILFSFSDKEGTILLTPGILTFTQLVKQSIRLYTDQTISAKFISAKTIRSASSSSPLHPNNYPKTLFSNWNIAMCKFKLHKTLNIYSLTSWTS